MVRDRGKDKLGRDGEVFSLVEGFVHTYVFTVNLYVFVH